MMEGTEIMVKHEITRSDILPMEQYAEERSERRSQMAALKKNRRVAVGPDASFYFENYDTMWYQVHEMLHVERGGEEQIADELEAYNPLIPKGNELVATLMFEINDPDRRNRVLSALGGVESTIALTIDNERISAVAEDDVERTKADGKTSSVHFLHFPMTAPQVEKFKQPNSRVLLSIDHQEYAHMTVLPEAVRASLSDDLD